MVSVIEAIAAPVSPAGATARRPMDVRAIRLGKGFLGDWQQTNHDETIPHSIDRLETTGVLDNLRRLVGESGAAFRGPLFADSDLYKTLEAIGWEAVRGHAEPFLAFVDNSVRLLRAVQEADGYLNSYWQGPRAGERFEHLIESHEFYCLGHLVQAAIAWSYAGRSDLLEIALRSVELVHTLFGEGARDDLDGHPEIETALVELSRATGDPRHRDLARRMVELRGRHTIGEGQFGAAYYQDSVPVRESREPIGHAVRQLYLLAGVTDLELDGDSAYTEALDAIWSSTHNQKMYITGGLGSRHRGEAFGDPYELPSDRAYSESCAAIANLQWNWRMLLRSGSARYADEIERGIYNAIAVSTSVDGRSYFYSNPLQLRAGHVHEEDAPSTRLDWYFCACCPPNLARLMSSISGYLVTTSADAVQFHLYAAGRYDLGADMKADVRTNYPWDGAVEIDFDEATPRPVELRIPAWAHGATLLVDGADVPAPAGDYAVVPEGAKSVALTLPVEPAIEKAHPWVDATRGTVALRRGPLYYCLEAADLPDGVELQDIVIPVDPSVRDGAWNDDLHAVTLTVDDAVVRPAPAGLYGPLASAPDGVQGLGMVTAIPYFRWANRQPGAMRVWMPTT